MKRTEYFGMISELFKFKTVRDECDNEFVLFEQSCCNRVRGVTDKTEFEAIENHIHLLDNIKKEEMPNLVSASQSLGEAVLCRLKSQYPDKHFMVYITIKLNDSMIIRFHQKWEGEYPYYNPEDFTSPNERVFLFE